MENQQVNHQNVVLFVLGSTASGKSKLALDLAEQFNGEIINADSMQLYSGNGKGTMTARPSAADYQRVPHHLYEIAEMTDTTDFNVQKYAEMATSCIADIHGRGKVPTVVGGTNYYVESLLFENISAPKDIYEHEMQLISQMNQPGTPKKVQAHYDLFFWEQTQSLPEEFHPTVVDFHLHIPADRKADLEDKYHSTENSVHLHALLKHVDPQMAEYLHSRDRRKIVNALFKYFRLGVSHFLSEKLRLEKGEDDGSTSETTAEEQISSASPAPRRESELQYSQAQVKLRYLPILVWIRADEPVL